MGVEAFTNYIAGLNLSNPLVGDPRSEGQQHLTGIKRAVQESFPNVNGACTATPTQFNFLNTLASGIVELGNGYQKFTKPIGFQVNNAGVTATPSFSLTSENIGMFESSTSSTITLSNFAQGRWLLVCHKNTGTTVSITWTTGVTVVGCSNYTSSTAVSIAMVNMFLVVCLDATNLYINRLNQV